MSKEKIHNLRQDILKLDIQLLELKKKREHFRYLLNNPKEENNIIEKFEDRKKDEKICVCGGKYQVCHKSTHLKTKKHQDYINNLS